MAQAPSIPPSNPQESAANLLGIGASDPLSLSAAIREGLDYAALQRLAEKTDFSVQALGRIVHISDRTLMRRRSEGRLHPDESDRLLRISRIIASAIQLLEGDLTEAKRWPTSKQLALGGTPPLHLAETDVGAREVENLIGRLEHGVVV